MLTITIKGVSAVVTQEAPIVSGTIGMPIKFIFDSSWSSLNKVAVYRYENPLKIADNKYADVLLTGTTEIESVIPANVLGSTGKLLIGVCGTDGEDRTVTVFIKAKEILEGAVPSGFIPPHPDDLIDQIIEIAKKAPPYIGANHHWYKFNTDTMTYVDTEVIATGPNEISTDTETEFDGLIKGDGTNVQQAEAGVDYVAPVAGKGLSSNDYTDADKSKVDESYSSKHSHENKSVLDGITAMLVTAWNTASTWVTTNGANILAHLADTVKHITANERSTWNAKQNHLTAGENITIVNDVISATGGGGGTGDFEQLINRPKYNGTLMDRDTNIPLVPTKTSDLTNDGDGTNPFLTEHQSLASYRTSADQDVIDATKQNKSTIGSTAPSNPEVGDEWYDTSETGVVDWGEIGGTLANQSDLNTALANKVGKTDYATNIMAGIIRAAISNGFRMSGDQLLAVSYNYSEYSSAGEWFNIGKRTLENVLTAYHAKRTPKTTLDAVATVDTCYYLGTQTTVALVLPSSAVAGDSITCVFYSGSTATTLSISGSYLGTLPTPSTNQRVELSLLYDNTNWCLLSNTMAVE